METVDKQNQENTNIKNKLQEAEEEKIILQQTVQSLEETMKNQEESNVTKPDNWQHDPNSNNVSNDELSQTEPNPNFIPNDGLWQPEHSAHFIPNDGQWHY